MPPSKLSMDSTIRMNSGYEIPVIGYGVYETPSDQCTDVTLHALKSGYRHVDSAAVYENEAESAAAVLRSGLPRDQIFFTTKVLPGSISYEGAKRGVAHSLAKCKGVEYFDLVLLHVPEGGKAERTGAWDALVEAVEAGTVRSIGVSNYGVEHLDELEAHMKEREASRPGSGGKLSVNQVELHPWMPRPDVTGWCKARGVVCEAWAPLVRSKRFGDRLLRDVAARHPGKSEAQVLVRWSLQMGFVPLPKSVTPKRIEENVGVFDFELTEQDMRDLDLSAQAPSGWASGQKSA